MNDNHEFCGSDVWREMVREQIIPWVLGTRALGDPAGLAERLTAAGFSDVDDEVDEVDEFCWAASGVA